jgi:hypothetical protein
MLFALILVVIAAVVVLVWFFVARNPEQASTHRGTSGETESHPERSHFAPGDAGTEGQRG